MLAPHLAHDTVQVGREIDPATLPKEPITYAKSMYVTGQTRGPHSADYPAARNDFFSKPIELTKKPGIWHDTDEDHVYGSDSFLPYPRNLRH